MFYANVILLSSGVISENYLFSGLDNRVVIKHAEAHFIEMARKLRDIKNSEIDGYIKDGFCTDIDEVKEVCISYPKKMEEY